MTSIGSANTNGAGLGLESCYYLIKAITSPFDPCFQVSSQEGKGTSFSFVIPTGDKIEIERDVRSRNLAEDTINNVSNISVLNVTENEHQGINAVMIAGGSASKLRLGGGVLRPIRVLLVDDNPFNLFALVKYLQKLGNIEILQAYNGEESLHVIESEKIGGRAVDLILMDIQMPVMDGVTASTHLKEMWDKKEIKFVPIVAITAHDSKEISDLREKGGTEFGISDVYKKPISDQQVQQIIREQVISRREAEYKSRQQAEEELLKDNKRMERGPTELELKVREKSDKKVMPKSKFAQNEKLNIV